MADYTPVTVDDFTARFPIFADRDPGQLAAILLEAQGVVDTRWRVEDFKPATLYLMAHLVALDASQETDNVAIGPTGAGQIIASESISGMSTSYFNPNPSGKSMSTFGYEMTEYGRRFYNLLKNNFGGPVIV